MTGRENPCTRFLTVAAVVVAVAAAARSTWSPCGVSMLATVTPLAERGRGHRYRSTAAWFIAGGTAGGATLGLVMAALALGVRAAAPSTVALAAVACAVAVVAAASDTRLGGFRLPFHSRQVNERWLDQFRPWVYGAGFGWQIGAGLVTYIKTAALYLMIVLAALTASPATALAIGALFGLVRGLAVLLGRGIASPATLAEFHRRFTAGRARRARRRGGLRAGGRGRLRRRPLALGRPGAGPARGSRRRPAASAGARRRRRRRPA